MFAFVYWYNIHPRATWFHLRIIVASPDMDMNGPAVFLPISRIFPPCAIMYLLQLSSHTSFVTNNNYYEKSLKTKLIIIIIMIT